MQKEREKSIEFNWHVIKEMSFFRESVSIERLNGHGIHFSKNMAPTTDSQPI